MSQKSISFFSFIILCNIFTINFILQKFTSFLCMSGCQQSIADAVSPPESLRESHSFNFLSLSSMRSDLQPHYLICNSALSLYSRHKNKRHGRKKKIAMQHIIQQNSYPHLSKIQSDHVLSKNWWSHRVMKDNCY